MDHIQLIFTNPLAALFWLWIIVDILHSVVHRGTNQHHAQLMAAVLVIYTGCAQYVVTILHQVNLFTLFVLGCIAFGLKPLVVHRRELKELIPQGYTRMVALLHGQREWDTEFMGRCPACKSTEYTSVGLDDGEIGPEGYKCKRCKHYWEVNPDTNKII